MGVRTRPGIKHDHHHNQQREALAEQHRNGIGPCSPPAAGWYPGLCRWHCLLPRDGRGRAVLPLSLDGCWASAAPGAAPSSRVRGSAGPLWLTQPWCPGTGQRVPLVPWLCWVVVLSTVGAPANYGFFLYFFRGFFCFFGSKLNTPGALEKAKLCTGGCLSASPSAQGSEQSCCSRGGTVGRSQSSAPPAQPNPLTGASNLGYRTPRCPPGLLTGHWCGAPAGAAENGHSSMPL